MTAPVRLTSRAIQPAPASAGVTVAIPAPFGVGNCNSAAADVAGTAANPTASSVAAMQARALQRTDVGM